MAAFASVCEPWVYRNMPVADGDLVIRKSETGIFTLETYPERPQVSARTYRAALRLARGFAQKTDVMIWSADAKGRLTKVKREP